MTKEIDYVELLKLAHEKLGSQSDMIAELEKELKKYKCLEGDLIYIAKKELLQRDLEQQAKGLSEGFHATKEPIGRNAFGFMMHYCSEKNLKDRVDDLRNQAKAPKEQE